MHTYLYNDNNNNNIIIIIIIIFTCCMCLGHNEMRACMYACVDSDYFFLAQVFCIVFVYM